jgi:hypothetical protein
MFSYVKCTNKKELLHHVLLLDARYKHSKELSHVGASEMDDKILNVDANATQVIRDNNGKLEGTC